MKLVPARGSLLEQVLDETFPTWHEGLTRRAYGQLNAAQMRTSWGSRNLDRYALVDDAGTLLSTAKRYRLQARVEGRIVGVCGIGALFTPPAMRRRGYARQLIEELLTLEARDGAGMALLFSEIGAAFYERLSFRPMSVDEVTLAVPARDGAPAMLVRSGADTDLPALSAMHDVRSVAADLALRREPDYIQFALARKRLRAALGAPPKHGSHQNSGTHVEFHVAEEGASAVAYVVVTVTRHGWTVQEAGDRDPSGARLGAILQVLLARDPGAPRPRIRAWWPRGMPIPPQCQIVNRRPARDVMMIRALSASVPCSATGEVFYWRGDFF
jgi:GNAT superfamily N-acetyltransferase